MRAERAPRDPRRVDPDPVRSEGIHERRPEPVPADGADEGAHPRQPRDPGGGVGRGAAAADRDAPRDVRRPLQRPGRDEDDVGGEVAEDDDPRRGEPDRRASRGPRGPSVRRRSPGAPSAAVGTEVGAGRDRPRREHTEASRRMLGGARGRPPPSRRGHDRPHRPPSRRRGPSLEPYRMALTEQQLDRLAIDTIRTLAIDGVQQANSGHPGAPMGMAPMAYVLWTRFLRHAPTHPDWPDRDRFVLSAGHASMLLYSLLHLTGYDVSHGDLQRFRQWGSIDAGPSGVGLTPGVEATTGPLGQGFANGVGMAIAERRLAAEFDRARAIRSSTTGRVRHRERRRPPGGSRLGGGVAGGAPAPRQASIYSWDDNQIQLDGPTGMAGARTSWRGSPRTGGTPSASRTATTSRRSRRRWRPRSPTRGRASSPCGRTSATARRTSRTARRRTARRSAPTRCALTKQAYGWDPDRIFYVPDEVAGYCPRAIRRRGARRGVGARGWTRTRAAHPEARASCERRLAGDAAGRLGRRAPVVSAGDGIATRNASQEAIKPWPPRCPSCSAVQRTWPSRTSRT